MFQHFKINPLFFVFALLLLLQPLHAQSAPAAAHPYEDIHRLTEQGRFDEALPALQEISKSDPAAKNLSHEFGITYYRKGDYTNAVPSLQRAVAENPNDAEAIQLTGLSLYLSGKPADAIP